MKHLNAAFNVKRSGSGIHKKKRSVIEYLLFPYMVCSDFVYVLEILHPIFPHIGSVGAVVMAIIGRMTVITKCKVG